MDIPTATTAKIRKIEIGIRLQGDLHDPELGRFQDRLKEIVKQEFPSILGPDGGYFIRLLGPGETVVAILNPALASVPAHLLAKETA